MSVSPSRRSAKWPPADAQVEVPHSEAASSTKSPHRAVQGGSEDILNGPEPAWVQRLREALNG